MLAVIAPDEGAAPTTGQESRPTGTLLATMGFGLFPYRTGTLSRHSYGLSRVEPTSRLHINSRDAERLGIGDQVPVRVTVEDLENAEPVTAVSLVYDRIPEGTVFLAMTLEQAGTNRAVREARYWLMNSHGSNRAVPVRVEPAPGRGDQSMRELQPPATANVLNTTIQPL